jgi:hypothetical protein
MSEMPNLDQMLKLWSKKDLWNRIQDKNKRIAELEERLANSIRPKFKIGQEVFVNDWTGQLRSGEIAEIQTNQFRLTPLITYLVDFYGSYCDDDLENDYFEEKDVFETYEEAQAKLEELQGVVCGISINGNL